MGWHLVSFHSLPGGRAQGSGNLGLPRSGVTPAVPLEASRIAPSPPIMADFHDPAQGSLLRQRGPGIQALLTNTAPRRRSGTVMGVKPCKRGGVSEAQKPKSRPEEGDRGCPAICSPPHSRTPSTDDLEMSVLIIYRDVNRPLGCILRQSFTM